MNAAKWIVLLLFIALLAAPLLLRRDTDVATLGPVDAELIIVTPHNEQIRHEFARAFEAWLPRQPGFEDVNVRVVWSVPGGTSEIRTMLESQYQAALREARPPGGAADLLFGGGQYEHDQVKEGVSVVVNGEERHITISEPVAFDESFLNETYGENAIGGSLLYDPEKYWFGTALSAFGIVYNRDALERVRVDDPTVWRDLCHPSLQGWVALGNPAQSGSIRKSFDTIIQHHGWERGWRILRRMAANARYFAASSSKVPIDVSQGDAAAGVCIDFYGRYQVQAITDAGDPDRLGYIDPPGLTAIDADPISLLRGAPHPDLARMFIRFTLTEEAQALWQYPRDHASGMGPERFELRRLPVRRSMYRDHLDEFIDQVNPFREARAFENFNPDSWSYVALLFSAMAIDNHEQLRDAWHAITTHPAFPPADALRHDAYAIVTADDVADPVLRQMLTRFDAMPIVPGPAGQTFDLRDPAALAAVKEGWLRGGWRSSGLWPAEADPEAVLRREMSAQFSRNYERIIDLADTRKVAIRKK